MVQDCEPTRAGRAQALALGDARAWQAPIARAAAPITRSFILRAHATSKNTLSKRAENRKRSLRSVDLMFIICKFLHVIGSIMACALHFVLLKENKYQINLLHFYFKISYIPIPNTTKQQTSTRSSKPQSPKRGQRLKLTGTELRGHSLRRLWECSMLISCTFNHLYIES